MSFDILGRPIFSALKRVPKRLASDELLVVPVGSHTQLTKIVAFANGGSQMTQNRMRHRNMK